MFIFRCLDISTYEKSKLEELEEEALNSNVVSEFAILAAFYR